MSIKMGWSGEEPRLRPVGPGAAIAGRYLASDAPAGAGEEAIEPPARWAPPSLPADELATEAARGANDALLALARRLDDGKELDDPLAASAMLRAIRTGEDVDPGCLLVRWTARVRTGAEGRFPWEPASERSAVSIARTADAVELLLELSRDRDIGVAAPTRALLDELRPTIEDQLAVCGLALDPRGDTFTLWLLAHHPRMLEEFHALMVVVAMRYGVLARRTAGLVYVSRFPVLGEAPVSANAQLARGLWSLGVYPSLIGRILRTTARRRRDDGSWPDEAGAPDLGTTLVAADLLLSLDPTFDPSPTIRWLADARESAGWWRPEGDPQPWATSLVIDWLERACRPFIERFAWPAVPRTERDRKTHLARYEYLDDLGHALQAVPALGELPMDVAFCDLAHFGAFNRLRGQHAGDEVLAAFSATLQASLPRMQVVRDGGDEFIVIGPPNSVGLHDELEAFCRRWPAAFAQRFGPDDTVVAPRFAVTQATGATLMLARERLGVRIGELKTVATPEGGLVDRT